MWPCRKTAPLGEVRTGSIMTAYLWDSVLKGDVMAKPVYHSVELTRLCLEEIGRKDLGGHAKALFHLLEGTPTYRKTVSKPSLLVTS